MAAFSRASAVAAHWGVATRTAMTRAVVLNKINDISIRDIDINEPFGPRDVNLHPNFQRAIYVVFILCQISSQPAHLYKYINITPHFSYNRFASPSRVLEFAARMSITTSMDPSDRLFSGNPWCLATRALGSSPRLAQKSLKKKSSRCFGEYLFAVCM